MNASTAGSRRGVRPTPTLVALVLSAWFAATPTSKTAESPARGRRVADTRFTVRRGFFDAPFQVEISTRTPGATLRFTTNGTLPTADSGSVYTGPIPIATTTVLRAAGFKDGWESSGADTQTYLFPALVPGQTGEGFPPTWGEREGRPVVADYAMDPEIAGHPACRDALVPALRSLPALSVVADPDDLFGPDHGIYTHPLETGSAWERPASVELLHPDGAPGFHLDCGIRIQGGWNRRPEESPKHAFRLAFRDRYGAGKLKYPLFGPDGIRAFDELILRAGCNNTWLHWSGDERRRGDYLRDAWMRASHAAMGHPAARGRFVHLYLNGLYWGLYHLTERPAAPFVAAHFGGAPRDYDVRNGSHVLEGDPAAWNRLLALVSAAPPAEPQLPPVGDLLDLPALADFLLLNFYGANADWDGASNWYAARRRSPPGPFRFFVWDGERTLEDPDDNALAFDADDSPPHLFQWLRRDAAFRRLFAERARRHLTGDGALTPVPARARYAHLAAEIESALVAESARWGDYRRDAHPYRTGPYELYTRDDHWRPEIRRLLDDYFPRRTDILIRQFKAAGLWPE